MPIVQETQLKSAYRHAYCDQTIEVRMRRRYTEQRMLNSRRKWFGFYNPSYMPSDSSTGVYNIPAARRVIERAAVRVTKLLTPTVKWFEVQPSDSYNTPAERVSNTDAFMRYVMRKKIDTRSNISQLSRSMIIYGFCVLKTSVDIQKGEVWPTQRAVDPFSFYIYPETSPTIQQAEDVFEDLLFSLSRYNTFVDKGLVDPINRDDLTTPDWPYHLVERMAYQGISNPNSNVDQKIENIKSGLNKQNSTNPFVSLTEKWIRKDGELYQVYIAWNLVNGPRIVGFFKSLYDDPMYRMAIHRPLPGETYTTAQIEDIEALDDVQGDMFNQFKDAVDREGGFVAFGGSSGMRRDTFKYKGGAKWDFGSENPKDVMLNVQPPNTSNNFLRAWQVTNAMMQSMGGAGTIAEGQPGRNMPRSGEAVSSLINLGMADIQDIAEVIEQGVLTPGLSDIYKVANMIPEDQLMRIPGGIAFYDPNKENPTSLIKKRDIVGDFEYEWVGSLQFQADGERAQRLMIFLNMFLNPNTQQMLAQQGYTINLPALIQMVWRSGIGVRGLDNVVVTLGEMQQILIRQQQQSGMPIGPQTQPTNLPPDVQQLLDQVKGTVPQGQTPPVRQGGQNGAVTGLTPTLPLVTNGFTRR